MPALEVSSAAEPEAPPEQSHPGRSFDDVPLNVL